MKHTHLPRESLKLEVLIVVGKTLNNPRRKGEHSGQSIDKLNKEVHEKQASIKETIRG